MVVCALMVINHVRTTAADPLDSPALQRLIAQLAESGDDPIVREQVRAVDLLVRKAYFTSERFQRVGAWLLGGGIAVMLAALHVMRLISRDVPDVMALPAEQDTMQPPTLARWLVAAVGLGVVTVAIVIVARSPAGLPTDDLAAQLERVPETAVAAPSEAQVLDNWPSFRGPFGSARSNTGTAPTAWDASSGEKILWRASVPKPGFNSPVIWGDRVFLTGADAAAEEIYCFDADTGELIWTHTVSHIPYSPATTPAVSADTGLAAPTAAVDGRRVYAIFATGNLVAVDFAGNMVWGFNLGQPENPYGHASSLMTWEDLLLVQFDHDAGGNLYAFDSATGRLAWHVSRDVFASWASPILAQIDSGDSVVLSASPFIEAYNPEDGSLVMSVDCMGGEVGPSPAFDGELIFAANAYALVASIDPAKGSVVWESYDHLPDVSSPLAADGLLWLATSDGTVACFDASEGDLLWIHEFDRGFYSSPVSAGGNVYLTDRSGVTHIVRKGREFDLVGSASIGQACVTTPAIVNGRVYLRGETELFCIGE